MVEESDLILNFSDIDSTASLDSLFVHKDFQRTGITKKNSGGTRKNEFSKKYSILMLLRQ